MKKFRQIADELVGALLALTVILAAVKFGTLAGLPETPAIFPENFAGYLVVGLPPSVFGIVSAAVLLLELVAGKSFNLYDESGKLTLLFGIFIPLGALVGAVASPLDWIVKDYVAYYAGCGALALAAKLYAGNDARRCRILFAEAGGAALLVAVAAIEQYFFGFARMRAYVAAEIARGVPYSAPMLAKIADNRVFATMTSANVLAGFLLLTAPLGVVAAAKFGERLYPKTYGKTIFGIAAILLTGSVFLLTKTRGAFLAALIIAGFAVLLAPIKKFWKFTAVALCIAIFLGGAWFIHTQGRGFSSAAERASYVATALRVVRDDPATGGGWGSFHLAQMKYKTTPTDEAPRDPHNVLLSFLSQCGILGALPVAAALLLTFLALYRSRKRDAWHVALLVGIAAFLFHSMMEVNHLVAGSWGLLGVLAIAGATSDENVRPSKPESFAVWAIALLLGIATLWTSLALLKRDYAYSRYCEAIDAKDLRREAVWQRAAFAADPASPVIRETAGDAAWRRGDPATAEKYWLMAWELSPTRPALCRKLAATAKLRGDAMQMKMWLEKARELFPSDPVNR